MIKLLVSSKPLSLIDFHESGMLLDFEVEKIEKEKIKSLVNKQDSLFGNSICYLLENSLLTKSDLDFIVQNNINVIGTISKNTHASTAKILQGKEVEILNIDNTENEITPWNIVQSILDKNKKINENDLIYFSAADNNFRFLMNLLEKDYFRFLMLKVETPKELSKVMNEKVDYRYDVAKKRLDRIDEVTATKLIELLWKIDNINSRQFDPESSKRALISLSYL